MDFHNKVDEVEHGSIWHCLYSNCISDELSDVHFSFPGQLPGGQRISAHKMMLAFRSPVFKAMFYGTFPQTEGDIEITDITAETFLAFKRYIYTDELDLDEKTTFPLLHAAQKYQISSLLSKCEAHLSGVMAVSNACAIFGQAKLFSLENLENNALRFIAKNAIRCFASDDFLRLSSKDLKDILEKDNWRLPEIQIFLSVLKWTDCKLLNAKQNIDGRSRRNVLIQNGLLYKIAIPQLALEDFTKTVVQSGILTDEEQLYVFKAITMTDNSDPQRFQLRTSSKNENEILILNIDNLTFLDESPINAFVKKVRRHPPRNFNNESQIMETLTLKSYHKKALKIVSISIKPNLLLFEDIKITPNDRKFTMSIEDIIFKGTYKNEETWCSEINCYILPNEIIEIKVSFEGQSSGGYQDRHPKRPRHELAWKNKLNAGNWNQQLRFSWTEKENLVLKFDTLGIRLVENIKMVEDL